MVTFLWGTTTGDQLNGSLIKLPAGFNGEIRSQGELFQAVVIEGQTTLQLPDGGESKTLKPGSYAVSQGTVAHEISCGADSDCIIYVRSKGMYRIVPE